MPGTITTEAIVLRSIRYGEADRILHLYTPARGRIGAIAKGARRPRSRFGGRLEPFFRTELVLHRGRGELMTVTSASTVAGHAGIRDDGAALTAAGAACEGVLRLLDTGDPNPAAYNLLARCLSQLDDGQTRPRLASRAGAVAFRLKLALAAGFAPELMACARCGEAEDLCAFSGAAGGVVCAGCQAEAFPLSAEAHAFCVAALGEPLATAPSASDAAIGQADRAIGSLLEHHAHVRLRPAA